jgi:hypothetical protein
MLEIIGIKTKKGYYISKKTKDYPYTSLGNYIINGKIPKSTFHKNWFFIEDEVKTVEEMKSQPNTNYRYELVDKTLESDKLPLILEREKVAEYDEEMNEWFWKEEYEHLKSLYELKYDKQPDIKVPVEFKYETILELDEIKEFSGFAYPVQKTQWRKDGLTYITEKDVKYQLLDEILFPEIILPSRPCKLTSEQMYKIVRQYVKQHINYEVAEITSDYNFCFEVKKKIKLNEPYIEKKEILKSNGRPYKKPRYNTRYIKYRYVPCFEMTYSPKDYKGYTPIPEMIGENWEDLKNKVDRYCKELIEVINKPLVDCPYCKGAGVILEENQLPTT